MVNRRVNINLQSQIDAVMNAQTQALASAVSAQAVSQGVSTARPISRQSFGLDFANTRFLDKKIPFGRTSIGTYFDKNGVMRTAQLNKPRFHHSNLKESLGLLLEESRTNYLLQSADFTQASWIKSRCAIQTSTTKGVYSATAQKIVCDGTDDPTLAQTVTLGVANTSVTFSCWLWTDEANPTKAKFYSYGSANEALSSKIVDVTNKPTRVEFTVLFPANFASTTINFRVDPFEGETNTPANGRYMYIDACQLEVGLGATSYIPTTTANATRISDAITVTGTTFTDLFPVTSEGTMFLSAIKGRPNNNYHHYFILSGANTAGGRNEIRVNNHPTNEAIGIEIYNDGVLENSATFNITTGTPFMLALAWQKNDAKSYCNGTASADDFVVNIPANLNNLQIGNGFNSTLAQLCFWPRRVSNASLSALTVSGLVGKNPAQVPANGDLAGSAFLSPFALLREVSKAEFPVYGDGTSKTFNIRRDYDFTFAIVDSSGSTVTSQPNASCLANTDNSLVVTIPTGKTLLYSITPVFEY